MQDGVFQATPLLTLSVICRLHVDKRLLIEVAMFIVIDVATIVLASQLGANRGRDHRANLVPTVNDTMLIHEGVFC